MSEVLDVPAVTTVPLGELLTDIRNGLVVEQEKELPGIPITRIETISKGAVDMERVRYVRDTAGKSLDNFWLKKGDILFSHINSDLHLGKTAIVPSDAPLLHGMNLLRLRVDSNRLRPKYLHHWLDYCRRTGVFMAIAQHAVNQSSLNQKKITSLEVPLRSVGEQDEIVAELEKQFSRLDEAVANLQRVKANLKRYKASVLKAAVEGRLVETEATLALREGRTYETGEQLLQRILEERRTKWAGRGKYKLPVSPLNDGLPPLPDGWTWATSDQLTYLITSGSRGWGDFYSDTGVLFIRAQDIKTDALNLPDVARVNVPIDAEGTRSSVTEGDILVTITGANVTKSALVPALGELAFVSQHVALMKLSMPETASFVFNWIISPANGRKTLESWAYGAGKPGLSLEQVRALPIALPPLAEQARIIAEVDRHLSILGEVEAEVGANLRRALALRQATLARAFSSRSNLGVSL